MFSKVIGGYDKEHLIVSALATMQLCKTEPFILKCSDCCFVCSCSKHKAFLIQLCPQHALP